MTGFEVRCEVGLEASFLTPWDDVVWTDLSGRVQAIDIQRGRGSGDSDFRAGQATVVLDSSDRALDPSWDGGLVSIVDGRGLPGAPVRISGRHDGGAWRPLFTGFLAEDAWAQVDGSPWGRLAAARISAADTVGALPPLRTPPLAELDGWIRDPLAAPWSPDWWVDAVPVDGRYVLADGDVVPDRRGVGGLEVELAGGEAEVAPPATPTPWGVHVSDGVAMRGEGSDVMPSGDESAVTVAVTWRSAGHPGEDPPADEPIVAMSTAGGWSWSVACVAHDSVLGAIRAQVWDPAGDMAGEVILDPPDGYRFDAVNSVHRIVARFTATEVAVWVGGGSDGTVYSAAAVSTAGVISAGDLVMGPAVIDPAWVPWGRTVWSSVMWWRRAVLDAEAEQIARFGSVMQPPPNRWQGDTFAERMDHWLDAVSWPHPRQWHGPDPMLAEAGDAEPTFWQISESETVPLEVHPRLVSTAVESVAGALYALRDGTIRGRVHLDLIDPAVAAVYQAATAALTDEPAPATALPVVRRSAPKMTGPLLRRVANRAMVRVVPPAGIGAAVAEASAADAGSIARFGLRAVERMISMRSWAMATRLADAIVERRAWPDQDALSITIDPLGSADEWSWVLDVLELEVAVELTRTPVIGDPAVEVLQVQSEHWQITPMRATVTVDLARS